MPGIHTLPCAKWVCRSWCGQKNPSHVAAITLGLRRLEDALLSCSCLLEWKRSSIFKVLGRGVRKLVGAPELLYECQVISIELAESTGEEAFPVLCFVSVQWKNKPSVPLVVNPELFTRTNIWSSTVDGRTIKSLLIIAVQTSLQALYIIYLQASHIRSTEVTQTGTMFNTSLFFV